VAEKDKSSSLEINSNMEVKGKSKEVINPMMMRCFSSYIFYCLSRSHLIISLSCNHQLEPEILHQMGKEVETIGSPFHKQTYFTPKFQPVPLITQPKWKSNNLVSVKIVVVHQPNYFPPTLLLPYHVIISTQTRRCFTRQISKSKNYPHPHPQINCNLVIHSGIRG
jgi:hypothetical protein